MKLVRHLSGWVLLSILLACGSQEGDPVDAVIQAAKLVEAPCPFEIPDGMEEGRAIQCGFVTVPEFHDQPDGRKIRLAVAIFPSLSDNPAPDPLVVAPSGPGSSALGEIGPAAMSPELRFLRAERDIVLIEYRGLPYSEPALMCGEVIDFLVQMREQSLSSEESLDLRQNSVVACRDRLRSEGIDLDAYNLVETAADLALVMTSLGYDKLNLYGTSAGTILAQHMMLDYPERLRSVIIDSTVPLGGESLQSAMPAIAARTLKHLFEICAADAACDEAYPKLEGEFVGLVATFDESPVQVKVPHPLTGEDTELVFNGDLLAEGVFMASAMTGSASWLPSFIHSLAKGEFSVLEKIAWVAIPPPGNFSWGLGTSVMCSEFATFTEEDIVFEGLFPEYEEAVAGMSFGPRALLRDCEVWDVAKLDPHIRKPVRGDVPTLLIAGQLDSLTPPAWAHEVAESLSNAYVYEIPGYGHSPTFSGPCPMSLVEEFLRDPMSAPDDACVVEMSIRFETAPGD
jgi:pimeloyl-ACP methyl ester carboxylesterase